MLLRLLVWNACVLGWNEGVAEMAVHGLMDQLLRIEGQQAAAPGSCCS